MNADQMIDALDTLATWFKAVDRPALAHECRSMQAAVLFALPIAERAEAFIEAGWKLQDELRAA